MDFINSNHSINLKWIYSGDYSIKSGHDAFQNYLQESKKNIDRFWYSNLYFIGDEHLNQKGNLFLSKILESEVFND